MTNSLNDKFARQGLFIHDCVTTKISRIYFRRLVFWLRIKSWLSRIHHTKHLIPSNKTYSSNKTKSSKIMHHRESRNHLRAYLHMAAMVFANVVLGLSISTLSKFSGWTEVRFTVAAVGFLSIMLKWVWLGDIVNHHHSTTVPFREAMGIYNFDIRIYQLGFVPCRLDSPRGTNFLRYLVLFPSWRRS